MVVNLEQMINMVVNLNKCKENTKHMYHEALTFTVVFEGKFQLIVNLISAAGPCQFELSGKVKAMPRGYAGVILLWTRAQASLVYGN